MLRNHRGHFLQHHELYPLLGLTGRAKRLPDAGFETTLRVGLRAVTYRCDPIGTPGHRLRFLCDCGRWIPFGRAGQHLTRCAPYQRTEATLGVELDEAALGGYSRAFAEASNSYRRQ